MKNWSQESASPARRTRRTTAFPTVRNAADKFGSFHVINLVKKQLDVVDDIRVCVFVCVGTIEEMVCG